MINKIVVIMICGWLSLNATPLEERRYSEGFWKLYTDALRGDKIAQFQVGVMYERGMGIEKNETAAASWYEKSAIQGYKDAQYNLGIMYASGRGVDLNQGFAMMWLGLSAKQGDGEAKQLVMDMMNGKLDPKKKSESATIEGNLKAIKAVRLSAKKGAMLCDNKGACVEVDENTTITSKSKQGKFYKVSGIGTSKGWEPYPYDGWVDENSVEIRR